MTRRSKITVAIALPLLLAGGVAEGLRWSRRDLVTVQTGVAARGDLSAIVTASGEIKPKNYINLGANAQGPITFLCATIGSGVRLGGDRDEDGTLNGSDCAPGDAGARSLPVEAAGFALSGKSPTSLTWTEQASATGPGILYDVVGGTISVLRSSGLSAATSCVGSALTVPSFSDSRPAPGPGACFYYLVRARNACGTGGFGAGRSALDTLACP